MDYRELLKRYMAKVCDCEGVSFVESWSPDDEILSEEDTEELLKIQKELHDEWES